MRQGPVQAITQAEARQEQRQARQAAARRLCVLPTGRLLCQVCASSPRISIATKSACSGPVACGPNSTGHATSAGSCPASANPITASGWPESPAITRLSGHSAASDHATAAPDAPEPMARMAFAILDVAREFGASVLLDMHESWAFFSERSTNGNAFLIQNSANIMGVNVFHDE